MIGFLHRVSYLLARLSEADVKEEVLRHWTSAAEEECHLVTSEFLSDASPLMPLILGLPSGASELFAPLEAEVDCFQVIPIGGSVAEGRHAKAQRACQATRARGLPRQCAWTRISLTHMRCHPR